MKWSELPKEYQDLEKKFNEYCDVKTYKNDISVRFTWCFTPQKYPFWEACYDAKSIADLPLITITDYPDIKQSEKKERYFIVFWMSKNEVGYNEFITYNGEYVSYKEFQKQFPEMPITNIIELSESDYNYFIA